MYIQICNLCVNACIWNFKKKKCLSQPWGTALTKAVPNPPLLPCINLLTWPEPFQEAIFKNIMLWNPTWLRRNGKIVYWGEHDPLGGNRRNVDEAVILTLAGSSTLTFPILSQTRFSSFFIGLSLLSSLLPWICWPTTRFLHNSCPLCPSKVGVALTLCLWWGASPLCLPCFPSLLLSHFSRFCELDFVIILPTVDPQ